MTSQGFAQNWADFNPRDYLHEYYADVGSENFALLQFAVKAFQAMPHHNLLLDFGNGPTIYPLIAATSRANEIHLCDYLEANLAEVRLWLEDSPKAFDWHEFFKTIIEIEGGNPSSKQTIEQRKNALRQRVTQIFNC